MATTTENEKAPPQYISHATNNPNVNRSYYFTCPVSTKYNLGVKAGKEMYKGLQDWKKHIDQAIGKAITNEENELTSADIKKMKNDALKELDEAIKSERNKPIINPAYT